LCKKNAEYQPDGRGAEQHPLNRCTADEVCLVGIASCLPKAACDDGSLCAGATSSPFCAANTDTRPPPAAARRTCNAPRRRVAHVRRRRCVQCWPAQSTLCSTDNTCVDAAEVAYAAHNGSGNTCTLAAPCDFCHRADQGFGDGKIYRMADSSPHYQGRYDWQSGSDDCRRA
jgi:hypothetical protein